MRKSIIFSLLLLGVTAISGQIILIRELFTAFYGNELSVGFTLAIWLLGGALGSGLLGVLFADRIKRKIILFGSLQVLLSIILPASVIFARVSKLFFGVATGEIVGLPVFLASSSIALLPVAVLIGFLFVLGCKILPERPPSRGIGRVYTLEAAGAMAGGAVTSLLLIRYLGALEIACMLSALNLLSCFFLLRGDSSPKKGYLSTVAVLALLFLAIFSFSGGIKNLGEKSLAWKWRGFTVLESGDSVYGRTTVTRKNGQLNFFHNGLFFFSSHDQLTAEETVHFVLASVPSPKRVLLIGGGASEVMSEILKYPVETVDYVELDPLIISLAKKFLCNLPFYALDNSRVKIINTDGRLFVKNTRTRYDAVIINLPNPYTARINRFYTEEFFKEVKCVLAENAVVGFSVTSSENYLSKEQALFLKTLFETARAVFADVKIIPGDTAHFLLSDKKGVILTDPKDIAARLKSRNIKTLYVRDYYLSSKLSPERLDFLYSAMRRAAAVRKNTDFYPISYFYDMVLWSTYFSFRLSEYFMILTPKHIYAFASFFLVFLFAIFFARRKSKNFRNETTILALCTTGLSEISFEILIVLAFQIIYGYLYYKVGIIITSFMFGLGAGSFYITRRLSSITRPFKAYIRIQVMVLLYPLILLGAFRALSALSWHPLFNRLGSNVFAVLPFVAGFVGGMQYPLANRICFEQTSLVGKTAGTTYAVDLLGSFAGAFLISTLFVPVIGIPMTCVLVVALNAVSLALLLMCRK